MTKIVIVVHEFYPTNAGVANATLRLSKALSRHGYDITVVTQRVRKELPKLDSSYEIKIRPHRVC